MNPDDLARRNARAYDVVARKETRQLRGMRVKRFAPGAGSQLSDGVRERVGVEPSSRSRGMVFRTQPGRRPVGGEKQH
jgi:hypothetical protein